MPSKFKNVSTEEARELYDLGASVLWRRSVRDGWCPVYQWHPIDWNIVLNDGYWNKTKFRVEVE